MRRRDFLSLVGSMAVWPMTAIAQPGSKSVIGFLSPIARGNATLFLQAYREGLKEAGFVEGQNVWIEYRWAEGQYEHLPVLAAELLNVGAKVITTMGDAAYAAKAAQSKRTRRVPIVFALGDDPVESGLVASVNNPGRYITGATSFGHSLGPKKLEMLASALPSAKNFGLLINPKQTGLAEARDIEHAARKFGLTIRILKANSPTQMDEIFANIRRERLDGLIVSVDTLFLAESTRLGSLTTQYSIPAIGSLRSFSVAGGLMSFNGSIRETMFRAGVYTGLILKGVTPDALPVYLPTKYDLVVNLKSAKAMNLTLPPWLLARADELIE
ncbi:MAG: ABC transporter substrate-binding protein [Nitrospirota bacterium]